MSAEDIPAAAAQFTRSFWAGRYLQLVESGHHTCTVDSSSCRIQLARETLSVETTSLSPVVHEMVVRSITKITAKDDISLLLLDGSLDWSAVTAFLEQGGIGVGDKDYSAGGKKCAELAFHVHQQLTRSKVIQTELEKRERFIWTHSPELFASLVTGLESECPLLILLMSTAALERALGDVYMSVSTSHRCPPLLRDLLATRELEQVLGPTVVFVLSCVIGPPSGLNLRNIAWHGFISPSELSVKYCALVLVLAASIGPLLSLPPSFRPYLTLTCDAHLSTVFQKIEPEDSALLEQLVAGSYFVLPTMLPVWRSAINAFTRGRYAVTLVTLLPALEHSLRIVFAVSNDCPHRAITAESASLYTTFDEILNPVLPSGEKNKLVSEIGAKKMEMLLDVLVHSEGPRVRDRISHGEVDFNRLSEVLANHVLCMSLLFSAQYCLNKPLLETPLVQSWLSVEADYCSLFHPLSLLKREFSCLLSSLSEWESIPRPDDVPIGPTPFCPPLRAALVAALRQLRPDKPCDDCCGGVEDVRGVMECVWGREMTTLCMEGRDLELVGAARRTVGNARETVTLYRNKQLRSRQRPNYQHLLSSLTGYSDAVLLLVVLSLVCLYHMPLDKQPLRVIKYQKKLLQFSENTGSQCSRHRWSEVDQLCTSLSQLAAAILSPVESSY